VKAIAVDETAPSQGEAERRADHLMVSVDPKPESNSDPAAAIDRPNSSVASTSKSPRRGTKIAGVIKLLQGSDGVTLVELVANTGWLPHTARAALTGLRKRGYAVVIDRADKARGSVYRIEPLEMTATPRRTPRRRLLVKRDRIGLNVAQAYGPVRRREMGKHQQAGGAGGALVAPAPSSSERERLEAAVSNLSGLNADQLRLQWRNHLGGMPPAHLPGRLLARVLAYRIQAAAFGDHDRAILRRLREMKGEALESRQAPPFATRGPTTRKGVGLKSGALVVREWNGRIERVTVLDEGYAWSGRVYRSLSQAAKAITGTNWNGHRFFGLKASGTAPRGQKTSPRQHRTQRSVLAYRTRARLKPYRRSDNEAGRAQNRPSLRHLHARINRLWS
jgi:DUF2924 family protein/uncharacterized protein DUF3489